MNDTNSGGVLLRGVGIGGYRSLHDLQLLGELSKVTLLAGQNNAGKSNLLRFVSNFLSKRVPAHDWRNEPLPAGPPLRLALAYPNPSSSELEQVDVALARDDAFRKVLKHDAFHLLDGCDDIWIEYVCKDERNDRRQWHVDEEFLARVLDAIGPAGAQALTRASQALTQRRGGGRTEDIRRVVDRLFPFSVPQVARIEAFRQIVSGGREGHDSVDHNGGDLIRRLATLQNPPAQRYDVERKKFDAINRFAQTVLEDKEVRIEVPASQDEVSVRRSGRMLPLESLGTGIHQVIILAAAATTLERTVVCIEEPEIHLHPLLQRKLVRYLSDATSNQYLIATHSAHMLDYERATVLHVKYDREAGTTVASARSPQAISDLCGDLGYRASDIIQANAVIWVEGPSDRVYLKHWLQMTAPDEFVEGVHFSIMFYGGGLLRHLTADDPSIDEFISLRRLNRHSAIVIDSDREGPRSRINATKRRIREEFGREEMPGFAWVTDCRTIENYVPDYVLIEAVKQVHPRRTYTPPADKWANPLDVVSKNGSPGAPDKVKIARRACELWLKDNNACAPSQMQQVVDFIRHANGQGKSIASQ